MDILSIDPGDSATFDAHKILNGAERYGIENLANLRHLPATGADITVGVIPFKQGSGGPAKVLAAGESRPPARSVRPASGAVAS